MVELETPHINLVQADVATTRVLSSTTTIVVGFMGRCGNGEASRKVPVRPAAVTPRPLFNVS